MNQRFINFIREKQLLNGDERSLLALSGGMDSMLMLEMFVQAGFPFGIVHCNFTLRGADADKDEAFVKKAAENLGVEFYSKTFDTKRIAAERGDSIQMAARDLRYEYFHEVAEEHGYHKIALAHHLDDEHETFFVNLLRGCGIAGLHGIAPLRGKLIRPLMFAYRREIADYVQEHKIAFREDASNSSLKYIRNRIRHEIMPLFSDINPSFSNSLTDTIRRLQDTETMAEQYLAQLKKELVQQDKEGIFIEKRQLAELHPGTSLLHGLLSEYGFNESDIRDIAGALEGTPGKQFFSASHRLLIDRKDLRLEELKNKPSPVEYLVYEGQQEIVEPLKISLQKLQAAAYSVPGKKEIAALDIDKLHFPLRIRKWKQGDAFMPLGMKNMKKLSDFFIDEKFSLFSKENTWLLCSGDDIVWIIGRRIDERYKIRPETKQILQLTLD